MSASVWEGGGSGVTVGTLHSSADALDAPKLGTNKWLRRCTLCHMYSTTKKTLTPVLPEAQA